MLERQFGYKRSAAICLVLPLLDLAIIFSMLVLSAYLYNHAWRDLYHESGLLCGFLFLFIGIYGDLYDKTLQPTRRREPLLIFLAFSLSFLLTVFYTFLLKNTAVHSRFVLMSWYGFSVVSLVVIHALWNRFSYMLHHRKGFVNNAAIIGDSEQGVALTRHIEANPCLGLTIQGLYTPDPVSHPAGDAPEGASAKAGGLDELIDQIREGKIQTVFIALTLAQRPLIEQVVDRLADTTVSFFLLPDPTTAELMQCNLIRIDHIPVIELLDNPITGVNGGVKRIEDIAIVLCLLPILLPVMSVIALLVALTSKGGVFFVQKRYGINGEVIKVMKFRSMTVSDDGPKVVQATKDDPRITPIGRFLRRTSLDELPQFFNVLTGSMSVIGPRPHAVAHNEMYRSLIKGYMMRHKVKPGITGWAQVNGLRGETETVEAMRMRVECDKYYIDNWSLLLDLEIIAKTPLVIFKQTNAY